MPLPNPAGRAGRGSFARGRAAYRNPLVRLIRRADRMDWRIKAQLTIVFALAMVIAMYLLRQRLLSLGNWGYLSAFIINAISSATIILPAPGGIIISIMAEDFNPILIGIAAGLGGSIGGLTAYFAGVFNASGARRSKRFVWFQRLMGRFGGIIIFTFALIPVLPGDFATLVAGAVRYPVRKYLLYNGIASIIKMTVMAYLGASYLLRLENMLTGWAKSWF